MARWRVVTGVLALSVVVGACSGSTTVPDDAPEGHTVLKSGTAHAPGLNNPTTNCAQCHGADLMGGDGGEPSCFSCHGKVW
jgi:cytochrome c553